MIASDVINTTIDRSAHTVLVVDDNAATRYSTGRVIRAAGFRSLEAGSGNEALALVASGVSAVVLDVHLPDIDGFEVCRMIRAAPATARLPVVHLSAEYIRDQDRVTGLNAGADAYLVHPVEPAVLVATLQALVRARLAEDELRRSEQRFRAIYDHAFSGIALLDAEGRFTDVNPAIQQMLGRSREQLLGQRISELAPPAWRERVEAQVASPAHGAPWRGEFPLLRADGAPVQLEWSLSPHAEPGVRIAIAVDASQRHELDQRRRDLLEREQAARQAAEHHSRTKDDFIAILSHELRTPLNAIVGWVHVLQRKGVTPEGARGLAAIERNVKTQARIISDILDVSRINAGKLQLHREWSDPAELITASVDALSGTIAERRITVDTQLQGASQPAWLDPARFQQIFWNLLTNAIKFSPEGGRVLVRLARTGDRLALTVQDHGQGIRREFLPHLFERFTQSDAPGNRRHGGLGLGMAIVKHLVDLHGGSVRADSAGEGHGTLVHVELPVQAAEDAQPEAAGSDDAAAAPEAGDTAALQGLDILLVEDNTEACEMMAVVLSDRGAAVRTVRDYEGALAAIRQAWPDVLVSDIGLPGRDGFELVRSVRELEGQRPGTHLPIIALTAFARAEDRQRALAAGFDQHLPKPLKPHALLAAIASCVRPPGAG